MIFAGSTTKIPDELLFAHQDGNVVFFCGAGISKGAGLLGFEELVRETAQKVNLSFSKTDNKLIKEGRCDAVYQSLERRIGVDRKYELRKATTQLLSLKGKPKDGLKYHLALLRLAKAHVNGRLHLVTTNYDNLFCIAEEDLKSNGSCCKPITHDIAPKLPIPKPEKWDGIVYLHGKLDGSGSPDNLDSLVLSSGDFGRAYLTERWAARFITDLFRNFTVCFVGYSANDAMIRYFLDALASVSFSGEDYRQAYAFDGYEGDSCETVAKWERIGIVPIPFKKENKDDFSELKRTLTAWSDFHASGINGSVKIILDEAVHKPAFLSPQDEEHTRRVLWALKTAGVRGAKAFAKLAPLEWIDVIINETVKDREMFRACSDRGGETAPPHRLIPLSSETKLDKFSEHILEWLAKHIDRPLLLAGLSSLPRPLSPAIIDFFEGKFFGHDFDSAMEPRLRNMWLLWLESERSRRAGLYESNPDMQLQILEQYGASTSCDKRLAALLEPKLEVWPQKRTKWRSDGEPSLYNLVNYDFRVAVSELVTSRRSLTNGSLEAIPGVLVQPIHAAMEMLCRMRREMGETDDENDYALLSLQGSGKSSYIPIFPFCRAFANLSILMRYAWTNLHDERKDEAMSAIRVWAESPYPEIVGLVKFSCYLDKPPDSSHNANIWSEKGILEAEEEKNMGKDPLFEAVGKISQDGIADDDCILIAMKALKVRASKEMLPKCKEIMEAILKKWYANGLRKDDGVKPPFREFFEFVAKGRTTASRKARTVLLSQLSNLALIDKNWTLATLVPLLSWKRNNAVEEWKGAIMMTWINCDLMQSIKDDFIKTAEHFDELGDSGEWYAHVVVQMALSKTRGFGPKSYRRILSGLSDKGRTKIAEILSDRLDSALDNADACWGKEVGPFVKIWPGDAKCMNAVIAEMLLASIAYCDTAFPDAARTILGLYGGKVNLFRIAIRLSHPPKGSFSRCKMFPNEVLEILSRGDLSDGNHVLASAIGKCLEEIASIPSNCDSFAMDHRFQQLTAYVEENK